MSVSTKYCTLIQSLNMILLLFKLGCVKTFLLEIDEAQRTSKMERNCTLPHFKNCRMSKWLYYSHTHSFLPFSVPHFKSPITTWWKHNLASRLIKSARYWFLCSRFIFWIWTLFMFTPLYTILYRNGYKMFVTECKTEQY